PALPPPTPSPYTTLFRSLHGARSAPPGGGGPAALRPGVAWPGDGRVPRRWRCRTVSHRSERTVLGLSGTGRGIRRRLPEAVGRPDRKSTRLNSSHEWISY